MAPRRAGTRRTAASGHARLTHTKQEGTQPGSISQQCHSRRTLLKTEIVAAGAGRASCDCVQRAKRTLHANESLVAAGCDSRLARVASVRPSSYEATPMKRLAALTLLAGILALNPVTAQDRKSSPPDPVPVKPQRTHYTVRHADALVLAEVVGAHFKGDATLVAAPAGSGNAVLVSGSPATVAEVVKLLEQLDKKPRTVEVEIIVTEFTAPKDAKEPTPADLAKAEALAKEGKGQRIKLTAVEGQQIMTQTGGNKPFVSGAVVGGGFGGKGGGGLPQRSINYQAVGTTVKMTPRIGADNAVALELSLTESKVRQPDA